MADPTPCEPIYISAACSRSHATAARPQDGLVAFASGHLIALWRSANTTSAGVHRTLPGHMGDVTALDFVQSSGQSRYLVSGDATGTVRVWQEQENDKWSALATFAAHQGSVSAVQGLQSGGAATEELLVVSGGSDSAICTWRITQNGHELLQTISMNGKIPLAFATTRLPASQGLLLAVGGTEQRIHLFAAPSSADKPQFRKALSLEGHTDWVRCLSFITPIPATEAGNPTASTSAAYDIAPGEVLLASGSQDHYIRLWRVSRRSQSDASATQLAGGDEMDELDAALAAVEDQAELRVKAHDFTVEGESDFSCASEAVLLGHDAWVTGLNWAPPDETGSPRLELLSASADRSMILWSPVSAGAAALPDSTSVGSRAPSHASVWTSQHRFGEFTSSTNLGFFGALWGQAGRTVLANGWGGSWHVWKLEKESEREEWKPQVATTGHLGAVRQVAWEGDGEYLLSASHDMSARLHAPWRRAVGGEAVETWHELGRPQIHGYPLASVAFTSAAKRLQFVSGADEKIIRVFDAPRLWVQTLKTLSGVDAGDAESRPMAANIPPLGLSNRAVASPDEAAQLAPASTDVFDEILPVNFTVSDHPPFEEQLLGSMLWPEVDKIYGHPFELVSVASAHTAPVIASACKATAADHALIRLHSTENWQPVGVPLEGHALTITKLAFSPSTKAGGDADRWLLSVSRDRTWNVFERASSDASDHTYRRAATTKSHARIIWDGCWAADASFFATASRDKTVKVWSSADWQCAATLKFEEAATSVAATMSPDGQNNVLAVGLENGQIHLYVSVDAISWSPLRTLDNDVAHVRSVTTLAFSPAHQVTGNVRLASGSEDHSIRIFDIPAS